MILATPAAIADNVGDNVGDVAGTGGDIFDSYVASVVAAMLLGTSAIKFLGDTSLVVLPLILCAAGIFAALGGGLLGQGPREREPWSRAQPRHHLYRRRLHHPLPDRGPGDRQQHGHLLGHRGRAWSRGVIIGFTSDFFTDIDRQAVYNTAEASQTGSALTILTGFSYGLLSIVPAILGICAATLTAYYVAEAMDVAGPPLGHLWHRRLRGGHALHQRHDPDLRRLWPHRGQLGRHCRDVGHGTRKLSRIGDKLDAAGNTAKAITKGFAIGAAALTVLSLFAAYTESVGIHEGLNLLRPTVLVGVFLGASMPPLFSALLMLSVSRNAYVMVNEVRRQFREIPGLLEGTAKPDYARCVDIASAGALKELILPGSLALLVPIVVGVVLGKYALGGFLGGSIFTGSIFALLMSNAGGLWDNAKKFIEGGAFGGKGSDAHKAAVVGDTVGDPFKDTAGPSLKHADHGHVAGGCCLCPALWRAACSTSITISLNTKGHLITDGPFFVCQTRMSHG